VTTRRSYQLEVRHAIEPPQRLRNVSGMKAFIREMNYDNDNSTSCQGDEVCPDRNVEKAASEDGNNDGK